MADTDDAKPRVARKPKTDPVVEVLREVLRVQELQLEVLENIHVVLQRIAEDADPGPNPGPKPVRQLTITPGTPTPK